MSSFLKSLEGAKSPYYGQITMAAKRGDYVVAIDEPGCPMLDILDSHLTEIKAIYVQVVKVSDSDTGEAAYVRRIVADIGDGREMDIVDPVALDADLTETGVDTSICAACGLPLDAYDLRIHDGLAYHKFCMSDYVEGGEEAPS